MLIKYVCSVVVFLANFVSNRILFSNKASTQKPSVEINNGNLLSLCLVVVLYFSRNIRYL